MSAEPAAEARAIPVPLGAGTPAACAGEGKDWDEHVEHVEAMSHTPAFEALRAEILRRAAPAAGEHVLDIGAGTGLLALAAAPLAGRVTAVDISEAMCARLADRCRELGLGNVDALCSCATSLPLPAGAIDVVLSSYCFHHLDDPRKELALRELASVLRPGGRLVFADMMFRLSLRGGRNRAVLAVIALRMLRKGIPGLVRLLRNAARVSRGRSEHPAGAEWWSAALARAGFVEVDVRVLDRHEGGIAFARTPLPADQPPSVTSAALPGSSESS